MFVAIFDNNKYLKNGETLHKPRLYPSDTEEKRRQTLAYFARREAHWYTDNIDEARLFATKTSAKCAANRGSRSSTILEVEVIHKVVVKL